MSIYPKPVSEKKAPMRENGRRANYLSQAVVMPDSMVKALDDMMEEGMFLTRRELYQQAMREWLAEKLAGNTSPE